MSRYVYTDEDVRNATVQIANEELPFIGTQLARIATALERLVALAEEEVEGELGDRVAGA